MDEKLFTQQQVDEAITLALKKRRFISHGGDPMFTKAEVEQMMNELIRALDIDCDGGCEDVYHRTLVIAQRTQRESIPLIIKKYVEIIKQRLKDNAKELL